MYTGCFEPFHRPAGLLPESNNQLKKIKVKPGILQSCLICIMAHNTRQLRASDARAASFQL